MGQRFEFTCDCGYSAEVSGGKDVGMVAAVQTMTCRECTELCDVIVGRSSDGGSLTFPDLEELRGKCPRCEQTNVTPWSEPFPCPKCGASMTRGPLTMHWD